MVPQTRQTRHPAVAGTSPRRAGRCLRGRPCRVRRGGRGSGYNGESQGTALARVLFGQQDPAGHLDFTWYADDAQLAPIANYGLTPSQTGGLGRTYMYFTQTPTYPFGYGLSYGTFKYSDFQFGPRAASADGTEQVSFDVTNTGTTAGATVAQLYATPKFTVPGTELPAEQLAGFQKTRTLKPGQTQRITLRVALSSLSQWDEQALKQVVYDGAWQFRVGPDSATAAGTGTVEVHGAITPHVQYVTVQPDQVVYQAGQTLNLNGANPWIAPDTDSAVTGVALSVTVPSGWTATPATATRRGQAELLGPGARRGRVHLGADRHGQRDRLHPGRASTCPTISSAAARPCRSAGRAARSASWARPTTAPVRAPARSSTPTAPPRRSRSASRTGGRAAPSAAPRSRRPCRTSTTAPTAASRPRPSTSTTRASRSTRPRRWRTSCCPTSPRTARRPR
ncbi:MAG: fibronectin type III-like domain-contianing protein [Trebonia sp.]